MKSNTKIIITIVSVVLIAMLIWQFDKGQRVQAPVKVPSTPSALSYFCTEGTIEVAYGDNQATLKPSDGRTLVLPQVMSGSGTRYENETISFITKGDSAYLQEGDKTTYSNCIVGTVTDTNGTKTFTDGSKTFSFAYPGELRVTGGDIGYTSQWRNNTQTLGLLLAKVSISRSVQPKTNFSEATFTVGTSSDPQAITDCLVSMNGERAAGDVSINGITYKKFQLGDAGAGNFYDTTSYRTMHADQCYAIEYTIHSTNIGNYPPELGIKAFDKAAITTALEGMVQSFKFMQ